MSLMDKIQSVLMVAKLPGSICIEIGDNAKYASDGEGNLLTGAEKCDCTLSVSEETLSGIIAGSVDPMGAYFSGDLKIEGDMGVAMALSSYLKN